MKTMKTLVVDGNAGISLMEIPLPRYTSRQALVRTVSCGICGTDLKLLEQSFKGFPEETYPLMLGHEGVGCVVAVGSDVTSFKIGDRVLLPFTDSDPERYSGLQSAWGAFSEYGVVNDAAAYPAGEAPEVAYAQQIVPPDIDPVDAAVIVTFREILSNIKYFGIQPEDPVVVFGSGPVALIFVKCMNLLGIRKVAVVVRSTFKKELMHGQGAAYVLNSTECNVASEVRKLFPGGVPYVLDAVGSPAVVNQAMELLSDRGEILCYGVPSVEHMQIDWSRAPYNWKLNFQQMPSKQEEGEQYGRVLNWIREGKISLRDYISDYFDFSDILTAFQRLKDHKISKKAIIKYSL